MHPTPTARQIVQSAGQEQGWGAGTRTPAAVTWTVTALVARSVRMLSVSRDAGDTINTFTSSHITMVLGLILPALAGTVCVPQWTALTAPMSATTARASSVNRVSKHVSRFMMVS